MSSSNSRNFTFIVVLFLVIIVTFAYIIISNNLDNTITAEIEESEVGN